MLGYLAHNWIFFIALSVLIVGSVTDFLHIDLVIFQTGIFNMADVSIMMGELVLLTEILRGKKLIARPVDNANDQ